MAEGNFVFVYLTTYANISFNTKKYGKYMKNLVIMEFVGISTLHQE
jgi:hypothetical protein